MPEDDAEIMEMLNNLKEQLPDILKHQRDAAEMIRVILERRKDILSWLETNFGELPQVRDFIRVNRDSFGTLDRGCLDSLNTSTRFLTRWKEFLAGTALSLPKVPWVCPKCTTQNDPWQMRCSSCGDPKDLWADDFTRRA